MITFKQFLFEGGAATTKWGTSRATQADIQKALDFVGKALGVDAVALKDDVLGSSRLTAMGKKKDSGDVDIAYHLADGETAEEVHAKMDKAVNGEGVNNTGTKVASYAVPVGGDKKVQVDLMFVNDKTWAKWIFHSSENSKYNGSVRNELLMAALTRTQKPGKDFVLRREDGEPVARASYSLRFGEGIKRLFKMAKYDENKKRYNKSIQDTTPEELAAHLKKMGHKIEFAKTPDLINTPDGVAEYIFGSSVKAKDLLTAEDVIKQIKKLKNSAEILAYAKQQLQKRKFEVPAEL